MTDRTDEEVLCEHMEPGPHGEYCSSPSKDQWFRWIGGVAVPLLNVCPPLELLGRLREIEERLTEEQWIRYESCYIAMAGDLRRNMIHASATQKKVALATVVREK